MGLVARELVVKLENEVTTSTSNFGNQPLSGCVTESCHPDPVDQTLWEVFRGCSPEEGKLLLNQMILDFLEL